MKQETKSLLVLLVLMILIRNVMIEAIKLFPIKVIFILNFIFLLIEIILFLRIMASSKEESSDESFSSSRKPDIQKTTESYEQRNIINEIQEDYPLFDKFRFIGELELSFEKLTNKSLGIEKAIDMVSTEFFIEHYASQMDFLNNVDSDNVSTTSNLRIVDYYKDEKQIIVEWKYLERLEERNQRTGELIRGLTRNVQKIKCFGVVRAETASDYSDKTHCPGCGAPLNYAHDLKCNVCNRLTFDYNSYWLLNKIV